MPLVNPANTGPGLLERARRLPALPLALAERTTLRRPRSREDATFVFDDIRWSSGMLRAWRVLQDDERVGDTVDLGSMGVAFRAGGDRRTAWPPVYSVLHRRDPFARLRFTRRSS